MADILYPLAGKRVWVAGHRGMVGSALVRRLAREDCEVVTVGRDILDLTRQAETEAWLADTRPQVVLLAAARVGGILANATYPAEFIHQNLAIGTNVIHASHKVGVEKLLFLGSSCIYPRLAEQPISEDSLLTGALEPTNEWYAVAKIAGLKLCQAYRRQYGVDFISAMPTNLYGPGDNFDVNNGHVVPAMIRRTHEAVLANKSSLTIWGSGTPRREFLHVDDAADALVHLLKTYSDDRHINIGTGSDISILELARLVATVVGFGGSIETAPEKPDGTPRKLLDVTKLRATGWRSRIDMRTGLEQTYAWFVEGLQSGKVRLNSG